MKNSSGTGVVAHHVKSLLVMLGLHTRVTVQVSAALLLIQLPADAPERANDEPNMLAAPAVQQTWSSWLLA